MEQNSDFRKLERPPNTKRFVLHENQPVGRSNVEKFSAYPVFKEAEQYARTCNLYANAYVSTILQRLEKEDPSYFADKDFTKEEIANKVMHNLCLELNQYRNKVFQETLADMMDKQDTRNEMRKLNNGGQKFHPYF